MEIFHEAENPLNENYILPPTKWTKDIEIVLSNIAHNCGLSSEHHKKTYIQLVNNLKYYKIPIIILSGLNSLASISLSNYIQQELVSVITACISLIVSSISSVELYLSIQRKSDEELLSYKSFYTLALKINAMLKLKPENRHIEADVFLQSCLNEYETLFNNALVNGLAENDEMVELRIIK